MQIRKAIPSDKENLVRLLLTFHKFTQNNLSKKQADFREYEDPVKMAEEEADEGALQEDYICFVADENGSLKGFIKGEVKEKKNRVYDKAGYIQKWFVEEEYQNHGIGRELFDKLVEEFKKEKCTHLELDTHIENEKAMQIYESLGFTKRLVTFFKLLED